MSIFSKQKKNAAVLPDSERMRYEVARNIYPTIITQCYREAHTETAYRNLPQTASKKAIEYADELIKQLTKTK